MALHEIRKLNRTVKQTAERRCREASPSDPDRAPKDFVNIWKASELMSKQFDVLELLADESLASLPLNTISEPYRAFDKCARIYREHAGWQGLLVLWSPPEFFPQVKACDKTFPILASVLIENAVKYAVPGTEIRIEVRPANTNQHFLVEVTNFAEPKSELSPKILQKGVRGSSDNDGSAMASMLQVSLHANTALPLHFDLYQSPEAQVAGESRTPRPDFCASSLYTSGRLRRCARGFQT